MKNKGFTVGTYINKTKKNANTLPICPICKRCKEKKICSNRKNKKEMDKCKKCKNCKDSENCDKFYITVQSKATLTIGKDPQTKKPIKKTFTADTEEQALTDLLKYKDFLKENGNTVNLKRTTKTITTIGQELEDNKYRKGRIGGNAYNTNMCTLNRIKGSSFANTPIEKVTKEQIENFLEKEREKSNSLIKKDYSMLRRIYNYAIDNMYIQKNYFAGINPIEMPKSKKPDKKVQALTLTEQRKFENYLDNDNVLYKNIFSLLLYTGIRIGEALALDISDVDLDSKQIKIYKILTKEKDGTITIHHSSSSSTKDGTRTVEINELFYNSIKEAIKQAKGNKKNKEKLLFPKEDGSLIQTNSVNSVFKRICEKAEITKKDINTHCLRHTFATRCIEAGVSLPVLQKLMGHDRIQTTIDTYGDIYNYYQKKEKQKYIDYIKAERT